jgi:hypothetical protein
MPTTYFFQSGNCIRDDLPVYGDFNFQYHFQRKLCQIKFLLGKKSERINLIG